MHERLLLGVGATAAVPAVWLPIEEPRAGTWPGIIILRNVVCCASKHVSTQPTPRSEGAQAGKNAEVLGTRLPDARAVSVTRRKLELLEAFCPAGLALPTDASVRLFTATHASAGPAVQTIGRRIRAWRSATGSGSATASCSAPSRERSAGTSLRRSTGVRDTARTARARTTSDSCRAASSRQSFALTRPQHRPVCVARLRPARAGGTGARGIHAWRASSSNAHTQIRRAGETGVARAVRVAGPAFYARRRRVTVAATTGADDQKRSATQSQSSRESHRCLRGRGAFHAARPFASEPGHAELSP